MNTPENISITVESLVHSPVNKVWEYWTNPVHITKWNFASEDWHTPWANSDFRVGGIFVFRMEAKDGSMGFDFTGRFDVIQPLEYLEYTLCETDPDHPNAIGRKVKISFTAEGNSTRIVEHFDAEQEHSVELQRKGWQAILDNFKKYTERN